jgi:hypothetical protein
VLPALQRLIVERTLRVERVAVNAWLADTPEKTWICKRGHRCLLQRLETWLVDPKVGTAGCPLIIGITR